MPLAIDNLIVESLARIKSMGLDALVIAVSNGTLALDAFYNSLIIFTGSTAGQIVQLPDATTLTLGRTFKIWNNSSTGIIVQDFTGNSLINIEVNGKMEFGLQDLSSTSGVWDFSYANRGVATFNNNGYLEYSDWRLFRYPRVLFHDFLFETSVSGGIDPFTFTTVGASGGADTLETGTVVDNSYDGRWTLSTGTTFNGTGRSALEAFNAQNKTILGGFEVVEWRVRIPTLSTAGVAFQVRVGASNGNSGDPTDGVYFAYTHSNNLGQWQAITRASSTSTTLNSSVAVVAGTWYKLRIEYNSALGKIDFFINDILIGTNSTNIPTAAIRPQARIQKTSTTTTSRSLDLDWCLLFKDRT